MAECSSNIRLRRHRLAQIFGATLAISLVAGSAQSAKPAARSAPETHVVIIDNMQFDPAELAVKRGDRVTWVNKDLFPHTATALAKSFDSASIEARASWTYVAGKPGNYAYVCTFHPAMKGRLTVQ